MCLLHEVQGLRRRVGVRLTRAVVMIPESDLVDGINSVTSLGCRP
jgi:hypothetical protein